MMIDRPFSERPIRAFMVPLVKIAWLDIRQSRPAIKEKIVSGGHSQFPVMDGRPDALVGILRARDLLLAEYTGQPFDLRALARPAVLVPEAVAAVKLLELFARTGESLALVTNKENRVVGLMTLSDVVTVTVAGADDMARRKSDPWVVQRDDGSWLVDGMVPVAEFYALLELADRSGEHAGRFQTVAGLALDRLCRLPKVGDSFTVGAFRVEVVDMDGWRIDKVLISRRHLRH
jgi:putative hemolysin